MMKKTLKERAIRLRRDGWSYNLIAEKLCVSKSTLSSWLSDIPYTPNDVVRSRVNAALLKTVMASHSLRLKSFHKARLLAKQQVGSLSERDLMMLGLGLFIGEGSKNYETLHIMNSNPAVLKLAVTWICKSLGVPIGNLRIALHLYPDNSERKAKAYWSQVSGVPLSQFEKSQVDRRTNKVARNRRKLPHGTAHIKVRACGNPDFGVLLHRRVMACVFEVYKNAGIV